MPTPPRKRAPRKTAADKISNTAKTPPPDADAPPPDLELIAAEPAPPLMVGGIECVPIAPLSTRHLFAMLSLVVNAYGGNLAAIRVQSKDTAGFAQEFAGMLLPAMLAQPNQAIELFASCVTATNSNERQALWVACTADPDPLALLDVLDAVITANGQHLADAVGKLRALLSRASLTLAAARTVRTRTP